jgi:hypothetical protein
MKTLLIQIEENGSPSYDFCYALELSRRYLEWSSAGKEFEYEYSKTGNVKLDHPDSYIPVGSVEFVEDFVRTNYGEKAVSELKPIYPEILKDCYLGNIIQTNAYYAAKLLEKQTHRALHVKSATRLKDESNGNYSPDYILQRKDVYDKNNGFFVGECIYPLSEWRVFVHDGELLTIKHYAGDLWMLPNEHVVKSIIKAYCDDIKYQIKESPTFCLDVGISPIDNATKVIELHEFYSCGLYGFDYYDRLPYMYSKQWFHILSRIKIASL